MKKTIFSSLIVTLLALTSCTPALTTPMRTDGQAGIVALVNYGQLLFILAGVVAALFVHWLAWLTRLRYLAVATGLGLVVFAMVAAFSLILMFPERDSGADGAYVMQSLSIGVWVLGFPCVLMLGSFQARSVLAPWWKGSLSLFFEAGLSFLILAGFNYCLILYTSMMDTGLLLGVYWERTALFFVVCLAILAVIRPIVRLPATGPA